MRIIEETQLDFCDVLIQPKRSALNSRKEVEISRDFEWKNLDGEALHFNAIPICASNTGATGTFQIAKLLSMNGYMCALEKHYSFEELNNFFADIEILGEKDVNDKTFYTQRISVTVGVNDSLDTLKKLSEIYNLTLVTIDIANGYMLKLIDKVKEVRKLLPNAFVIVGNVVTEDVTTDLILAGANCVKLGIGSGSCCLSRLKAGIGRPQLSTIIECADAAHQLHAYVMADGGCVVPGDICKAFCAGADFVMLGGMLAGCNEAGGELVGTVGEDGKFKYFKQYYGMSSKYAQEKYFGKFNSYRSSEGRTKLIPATGPLIDIIEDINGSIRSCCTYIGSHKIKHMAKHAVFYKVNRQLNTVFANCKDF